MKTIFSALGAVVAVLGSCFGEVRADAPIMKFGLVSDVHLGGEGKDADLENVLRHFDAQGVDAVMIPGDIAHSGLIVEFERFAAIWYRVFPNDCGADGRRVERLIVGGNHCIDGWPGRWKGWSEERLRAERFNYADNPQKTWRRLFNEDWQEVFVKTVKGIPFVGAQWKSEQAPFLKPPLAETVAKLAPTFDTKLPFFVFQHNAPAGTCFGKSGDAELAEALRPYPNAVSVSGHYHRSVVDDRNVWQGEFTALSAGCLHEAAGGEGYRNVNYHWHAPSRTKPMRTTEWISRGGCCSVVEVFADRLVVHRRSVQASEPLGEDWVVPIPAVAGKGFDFKVREKETVAPEFAADAKVTVTYCPKGHPEQAARYAGKPCVAVTFPAAQTPTGVVREYEVVAARQDGRELVRTTLMPNAFGLPKSRMNVPGVCLFKPDELNCDQQVVFSVTPKECFGKAGRPLRSEPFGGVMSEAYWKIWNDDVQRRIDADIERNRKADCEVAVDAPVGTEVKVEQIDSAFKFGAHIFNFNQLGKTEYNDAYKASYGKGGVFNQATVAFYWVDYEPEPGKLRAQAAYDDTEAYWNSLSIEAAQLDRFWRRPAPGPVIDFLKYKDVRIHGHILVWGSAKPYWIYDWFCPENEKRNLDELSIPRHADYAQRERAGAGEHFGFQKPWCKAWKALNDRMSEAEIAAKMPVFTREMRRIFRKRVMDVGRDFGAVVDSWDVVNESCQDWMRYRKARTGLPVWKTSRYGIMPGDYPLHALLDAKEAMKPSADLCINDWEVGENLRAQIGQLEAEGAKIDVVGCQMHIFNTNDCMRLAEGATKVNWVGTPATIREKLDTVAKTGKRIHVSEVTIAAPGSTPRDRAIQATLVRNIYRAWFSHPAVQGITWWNTVDGGGVYGEPLVSGLFTRDLKKKPAYEALDRLINHEWRTETQVKVRGEGEGRRGVSFRGFKGRYRLSWTDKDGKAVSKFITLE